MFQNRIGSSKTGKDVLKQMDVLKRNRCTKSTCTAMARVFYKLFFLKPKIAAIKEIVKKSASAGASAITQKLRCVRKCVRNNF